MTDTQGLDEVRTKLAYEYYKQQREEMMELGRESMSISFQILVLMATFAFGFWQISTTTPQQLGVSAETKFYFEIGVSGVIMMVGLIGWVLNINIEKLRALHKARARAARKAIGFLEEFANAGKRTDKMVAKIYVYYYFVCIMVIVAGGLLLTLTLLQGVR